MRGAVLLAAAAARAALTLLHAHRRSRVARAVCFCGWASGAAVLAAPVRPPWSDGTLRGGAAGGRCTRPSVTSPHLTFAFWRAPSLGHACVVACG